MLRLGDARFSAIPLFVSRRRLQKRSAFPRAVTGWALDSGGFTELSMHGRWVLEPREYVRLARRFAEEIGRMEWAAPQDWMCEPVILEKTGLTVREHQRRTVENFLELRELGPDLGIVPVVQGWAEGDYYDCVEQYDRAGVDLRHYERVGVGTICRRQGTEEAESIFRGLESLDIRCHAFGAKITGLGKYADTIESADSLAWSFNARKHDPLPGCPHKSCANCPLWAIRWYRNLLRRLQRPVTSDFLYTHSIHDIPYTEWVHMTPAEREEAAPGYTKGPPVVQKLPAVDPQTQLVAGAHATQAGQMLAWAQAVPVTMANIDVVSEVLTGAMARAKVVEAELKKITKPQNDALKAIRAFFNPVLKTYEQTEVILKAKISAARQAQIAVNTQATQAAQVALAAGDARGAALAANVIENTALPGNISSTPVLKWECTDENLVPRELCSIDPVKVAAWVKLYGETHACPGIRVWRDDRLTVRTAT